MKKEIKEISQVKRVFEIFLPKEETEKIKLDVLNEFKKDAIVPGFRKGKAPRGLIFQRYKKYIKEEIIKKIFEKAGDIEAEIKEKGHEIVGEITLKNVDFDFGKDFKAELEFEVMPDFEIKDEDIPNIEITVSPKKEVTEEDIEDVLKNLSEQHATFKPTEDEPVSEGDIVDITIKAGEIEERSSIHIIPYQKGGDLSELQKGLLGMKKGDEKELNLKASVLKKHILKIAEKMENDEDIKILVKVENVKKRTLPEINDEFAKQYFDKEDLNSLKEEIKRDLQKTYDSIYENEIKSKIMEKMRELHEFEIPSVILDRITRDKAYNSAKQVFGNVPQNIANTISGMTFERLEEGDNKEDIRKIAKDFIIISKFIEKNKIEVKDEDKREKFKEMAEIYNIPVEALEKELIKSEDAMHGIEEEIKRDKAFKMLKEKVKIVVKEKEEKEVEKKEEEKIEKKEE